MVKGRSLGLALIICWLAACAPPAQSLQTAVAQTQAAWTPTPTPTYTATITPSPSSIAVGLLSPASTSTAPYGSAAAGPGILTVNDTFRLPRETFGTFSATSPGKISLGTLHGTIIEYDRQTGAFGESISIPPGKMAVDKHMLLHKIGLDGDHLWASGGGSSETGGAVALFLPSTLEVGQLSSSGI